MTKVGVRRGNPPQPPFRKGGGRSFFPPFLKGGQGGFSPRRLILTSLLVLAVVPLLFAADPATDREEALWHHRNLGKAFYENPATQVQAIEELRRALELAPESVRERANYGMALLRAGKEAEGIAELERAQRQEPTLPHTWFNLGIAYKRQGRHADAVRQLERMAELVPDEPITRYNLGVLHGLAGDAARGVAELRRAAELAPDLAGPHYQLATAYRKAGDAAAAAREMELFRERKRREAEAAVPEDLEWSWYAELVEVLEPPAALPAPGDPRFAAETVAEGLAGGPGASLVVVDADGDGGPDLLAVGPGGARLFLAAATSRASGLEDARDLVAVVPGDADNDGRADLAVLRRGGDGVVELWRASGDAAGPAWSRAATLAAGAYNAALWLDVDHDYDLDLLLLGAASKLLRNHGEAGFADRTGDFPFLHAEAVAATLVDAVADTQGTDVAVAYRGRPGVLYRDRLAGRFEATSLVALPSGSRQLLAHDVDHDGWTDLVAAPAAGAGDTGGALLRNDRDGGFAAVAGAGLDALRAPFALADLENRGASDLVATGGLYRAVAADRFARRPPPGEGTAVAAADWDGDGRVDVATLGADGVLRRHRNVTPDTGRWLRVGLHGRKNLALAPGAEVEVKAGTRYQKKVYRGLPLHFGLDDRETVDTVRITWPNGLIQNEARQTPGAHAFEEAQRLSGSCPMIFTWDGGGFRFITDVLGVAPLGAAAGDGEYFPVDHDEWIAVPGEALVARDGVYEVRITEELREVAYLDEVRLVAVDHPADLDVLHNDKFTGPPFPEERLYAVGARRHPLVAVDHRGRDVTARVTTRDAAYPDGFARDLSGIAEPHHLELDFGADAAAFAGDAPLLVLSGWVDWADGSTFRAVAQGGGGLAPPSLEVEDADGTWRTVLSDMGLPAGKPKTIVVDLAGRLPPRWRRLRIATSLCVYWDEVYLARDEARRGHAPPWRQTTVPARAAELRWRGFSGVVVHPARLQPERFVYADLRPLSMWSQTPGLYTRYGDVRELLASVDDRFAVMGSGDELRLRFAAEALPPLAAGWRRDFLLYVDGWAKDGDANTAHSQTVGPLPYHAMPQYPYEAPHAYPAEHRDDLERYHHRPALRLHRPLVPGDPGRTSP